MEELLTHCLTQRTNFQHYSQESNILVDDIQTLLMTTPQYCGHTRRTTGHTHPKQPTITTYTSDRTLWRTKTHELPNTRKTITTLYKKKKNKTKGKKKKKYYSSKRKKKRKTQQQH